MSDAAITAKEVLATFGLMAVHGTVLVALAWMLTRGRRMRPAWQAAVWLVAVVKFVLPIAPALPWSLADLIASLRGEGVVQAIAVVSPAPAGPLAAPTPWLGWLVLFAIWALGATYVLIRANLAEREAIAFARRCPEAPAAARALLAELGGGRAKLVVGELDTGPHVLGLLRPIIVVPPALLADRGLLRAALLHELAHVRRLDAIGRLIQILARAAFWWFPVVAFASRRLDHAREAACDARALEIGQIDRPAYARLLLQMAQLRTAAAPALAMPAALDRRVQSVLGPPLRARLGVLHVVALVAWVALALGGARTAEARASDACVYTTRYAEALRRAHPEADIDQDGVLSRDEACELQAELRRIAPQNVTTLDEATAGLLAEPLCCNGETSEVSGPTCTAE